tara:strand:- start:1320 stop:2285 length:966 start_codon:yes stop_codon:yes gene_type:complete
MENVDCDLCCSSNNNFIVSQTDLLHNQTKEIFSIVKCNSCNLVFTNPRPKLSEIGSYYPKKYYAHKKNFFNNKLFIHLKSILKSRFSLSLISLIPIISRLFRLSVQPNLANPFTIKKNMFFLDIGCGIGDNTHIWGPQNSIEQYKKISSNIYAVEPDLSALKILRDNNLKSYSSIKNLPDEISFDFIRMNWSLEHTHSPNEYFNFISQRLSKNGYAIICVPNYNGEIYSVDPSMLELPIHLYHFTLESLTKYCDKHNLKIDNSYTFSYASMYYYASKISRKFIKYSKYSLKKLIKLQYQLDIKNKNKSFNGNDIVCVIRKN